MLFRSIRYIKPDFFLNEELAKHDPLGRILFAGLWTLADRAGRLEDRPGKIKIQVLPFDAADVNELLNRLAADRFIIRYAVSEKRFIQVVNFAKHQRPHPKEATSQLPPPPERYNLSTASKDLFAARSDFSTAGNDPSTALTDQSDGGPRKGTSGPFKGIVEPGGDGDFNGDFNGDGNGAPADGFAEFISRYPNQVHTDRACQAFLSVIETEADLLALMEGLERWLKSDQWNRDDGRFVPAPDRFLVDRLYKDHPAPYKKTSLVERALELAENDP